MSQAKVDQYKKEKHSRKKIQRKNKTKRIIAYAISTIVVIGVVIWAGWSIAVSTGLYEIPEATTTAAPMSEDEIESLREQLIQSGDKNVQVDEETTVAE